MKFLASLPLSLAVGWLFAGCGEKHNSSVESAEGEAVPLFQEKKGIRLPDEMKKVFGVETAEVAEQPMQREIRKLARVYREARPDALGGASVMMTTAETRDLKPGQMVRLKVDGSDSELSGELARVDEQTHSALGQAEALVEFADAQQRVGVGAFSTATFLIGESKPVLVVPKTALLTAADGRFVYAVNGEHFTRTKIKTGAATDGFVEVEEGLYSGDEVVAKSVESLWLIELSALKGGKPCCAVPKKETAAAK
jgi:hypothetical protein